MLFKTVSLFSPGPISRVCMEVVPARRQGLSGWGDQKASDDEWRVWLWYIPPLTSEKEIQKKFMVIPIKPAVLVDTLVLGKATTFFCYCCLILDDMLYIVYTYSAYSLWLGDMEWPAAKLAVVVSLGQALADAIYSCTYQVCFLPAVGSTADGATIFLLWLCRFHWETVGENGIELGL